MSTTVEVPGLGTVEFPDGMNPQQMDVEIRKHLSGVEYPYVPNDFGATPPPTKFGPSSRDLAESISKGFGSKFIAGQMQPGVLKALAEQATPANALMARVLPRVMSSKLVGIPLRALFGAAGAQVVGQAAGQRFSGVPQTEGEKSYLDAQMALGGAQVAAAPGLEKPVGALGSHLYETGKVLARLRPSDAVTQPFRLGGGVPQQRLGQIIAGYVNPPVAQEAVPSPFDKGRLFPNTPKPVESTSLSPTMDTARAISTMSGQDFYTQARNFNKINLEIGRNASRNDYEELKKLRDVATQRARTAIDIAKTGNDNQRNEAAQLASMPQFFNEAIAEYERMTGIRHDLRAATRAIQFGIDNKTLTPQQVAAFQAQGDALNARAEKGERVEAEVNNLYEQVRNINKKGAQNETASQKTPSAGGEQGSAQEGKAPTPSSPLQKTVPADVGAGVSSARGGVQQSTGGRVEPLWVKNILAIPEKNRNQGMREDLDNWMRGKPTNREQRRFQDEGGFITFGGKISGLDVLGWKGDTKVSGEQTFNRIRNLLGGESAEFKYWNEVGLKSFLAVPRTQAEVKQWMEENAPKVEVRKLGEGSNVNPKLENEIARIAHEMDTKFPGHADGRYEGNPAFDALQEEWQSLDVERQNTKDNDTQHVHWSSIAPKSEQDMPGYVEIAVVKPSGAHTLTYQEHLDKYGLNDTPDYRRQFESGRVHNPGEVVNQFPSSHNFPPNTLGFVRGYMETLPNGKKVFHVIEVQSDWARQLRHEQEALSKLDPDLAEMQASETKRRNDPLLSHYERLALKAAIDHARSEGATKIAISDAETAMMTEGHDRQVAFTAFKTLEEAQKYQEENGGKIRPTTSKADKKMGFIYEVGGIVTQEPGMRLHYDRTLPKIAEELTGSKGEKVSFGEHRMAYETTRDDLNGRNQDKPFAVVTIDGNEVIAQFDTREAAQAYIDKFKYAPGKVRIAEAAKTRKDLIFRNPDGTPKTDVSARVFDISKANKEMSLFGKDKPVEAKPSSPVQQMDKTGRDESGAVLSLGELWKTGKATVGNILDNLRDESKPLLLKWRGESVPRTAAADEDLGNRLYLLAQNNGIVGILQKSEPDYVLGERRYQDAQFDKSLGALLVENRLRARKRSLIAAGKPDEAAAIETVVGNGRSVLEDEAHYQQLRNESEFKEAIQRHIDTVQKDAEERHLATGGVLSEKDDMGAFINLKILGDEKGVGTSPGEGSKVKKTVFGQQFTGTGTTYDTSYRNIAANMVRGNYRRAALKSFIDRGMETGNVVKVNVGDKAPEGFVRISQDAIRVLHVDEEGDVQKAYTVRNDYYIKNGLWKEFDNATKTESDLGRSAARKFGDLMTRVQVSAGVDAAAHIANQVTSINSAARASIRKDVVGLREADTINRIASGLWDKYQNNYAFQQRLGAMAKQGIVRSYGEYKGLFGGQPLASRAVIASDQMSRMILSDIAEEMGKAGLIEDTPIARRRFVDKQMGQYNPRLMEAWKAAVKGIASPFYVAGSTFNKLAIQRLTMSPGVAALDSKAWTQLRARQLVYAMTAYIMVPYIANMAISGNPEGLPGTKFGQISWKDDKGQTETFDMLKWNFARRGLRITGAGTAIEQQVMPRLRGEKPAALGQTARQSFFDATKGLAGPYAGPIPNSIAALATGKSALGYEQRMPGEKEAPYVEAGIRGLNPLIGTGMEGFTKGGLGQAGKQMGQKFAQIAGFGKGPDNIQITRNLARQFNYKVGKTADTDFAPTEYGPLLASLQQKNIEQAKKDYDALITEKGKAPVEQYFKNLATKPFTGNTEREKTFQGSLTPHQKDVYQAAQEQRKQMAELFFADVAQKPFPEKGGFSGYSGYSGYGKKQKAVQVGQTITRGGENYTVIGFDTDGEPLVEKQ